MAVLNPNTDFQALYDFLEIPRSSMEIMKKFKIKSRLECLNFINAATYRMMIYETDKIKGIVYYGIYKENKYK